MITNLKIEGMSCEGCVKSLSRTLGLMEGIEVKQISVGNAELEFDETKVSTNDIKSAIEEIGFSVVAMN